MLFTSPEQPNTDVVVKRCYEIYGDFVMKNPFYSMEMPIRVEKFDRALGGYLVRPYVNSCKVSPGGDQAGERDRKQM